MQTICCVHNGEVDFLNFVICYLNFQFFSWNREQRELSTRSENRTDGVTRSAQGMSCEFCVWNSRLFLISLKVWLTNFTNPRVQSQHSFRWCSAAWVKSLVKHKTKRHDRREVKIVSKRSRQEKNEWGWMRESEPSSELSFLMLILMNLRILDKTTMRVLRRWRSETPSSFRKPFFCHLEVPCNLF